MSIQREVPKTFGAKSRRKSRGHTSPWAVVWSSRCTGETLPRLDAPQAHRKHLAFGVRTSDGRTNFVDQSPSPSTSESFLGDRDRSCNAPSRELLLARGCFFFAKTFCTQLSSVRLCAWHTLLSRWRRARLVVMPDLLSATFFIFFLASCTALHMSCVTVCRFLVHVHVFILL